MFVFFAPAFSISIREWNWRSNALLMVFPSQLTSGSAENLIEMVGLESFPALQEHSGCHRIQ